MYLYISISIYTYIHIHVYIYAYIYAHTVQIASLESFVAVDVPHRKNAAKFFLFLLSLSHVILRTYGRAEAQ